MNKNLMKISSKKGMSADMITKWVIVVVLFGVFLRILAASLPTLLDAGAAVQATGAPLSEGFGSDGWVMLLFMAAIVIAIIYALFKGSKK
jgi:hypothetical protein